MDGLILILLCTCILIDILTLSCAWDVMRDFLQGAIGKNNAKKEWRLWPLCEKVFLKKLKKLYAEKTGPFKMYYFIYSAFIYTLVPKYLLILLYLLLLYNFLTDTTTIIIGILVLSISIGFFLVFRIPQLPHGKTKFIHRRR